jgi:hypothetical protein
MHLRRTGYPRERDAAESNATGGPVIVAWFDGSETRR